MRVLVCGGRGFNDWALLSDTLAHLPLRPELIIHGAAPGADTLAGEWAKSRRIEVESFPADWKTHGRAAGPIRNQRMLDEGRPDLVIAFPGGKGTDDMVRRARQSGIEVIEIPR